MDELNIAGQTPERKPRTTDSDHPYSRCLNLAEGLQVNRLEQIRVVEITYIRLNDELL